MKNTNVHFFYQDVSFAFRNRNKLKSFLVKLFKNEGFVLKQINIIFCTDRALLEMNRKFLKHDYFTDIITFPLSEKSQPIEAELYISIDRIRENAQINNQTISQELHRVVFHGCLHLSGYNDKSSQQIKRIRERESHYMRLYFRKQTLFHVKHIFLAFLLFYGISINAQGVMTLQDKPFVFNRTVDSALWKEINKEMFFKGLTQQDQWSYYWTNYFRQNPKRFYNLVIKEFIRQFPEANSVELRSLEKDISKTPETLQLLYPEKGLLKMASSHSYDLEKRGAVISHISKTGKTFVQRINEAGNYRCGAENIYVGSPDPLEALIALLIDMGVPEKGHRMNLLDPKFGKMGVSFLFISPKKGLLDQVFACP